MVKELQVIVFRGNDPKFKLLKLLSLVDFIIIITCMVSTQNLIKSNSVTVFR